MDYIIASTVVTDEIRFADKKTVEKKAGGAGIYALCGIRLWCDSVMPVTGVGKDYAEMFGEWYQKNHISMAPGSVSENCFPSWEESRSRTPGRYF